MNAMRLIAIALTAILLTNAIQAGEMTDDEKVAQMIKSGEKDSVYIQNWKKSGETVQQEREIVSKSPQTGRSQAQQIQVRTKTSREATYTRRITRIRLIESGKRSENRTSGNVPVQIPSPSRQEPAVQQITAKDLNFKNIIPAPEPQTQPASINPGFKAPSPLDEGNPSLFGYALAPSLVLGAKIALILLGLPGLFALVFWSVRHTAKNPPKPSLNTPLSKDRPWDP